MFIWFPTLPVRDCLLEVQFVYTVSETTCRDCLLEVQLVYTVSKPTCRGLSVRGAACLYGFQTYLQGTVCGSCSLFIRFQNLPAKGLSAVDAACLYVSKPTCRGTGLLENSLFIRFQTYLKETSAEGAACLYGFQTYLQGTVCCRCSLFIRFPNLPAGDCLLEVQLVDTVSEPTCRGQSPGGANCLYCFQIYLQGTLCWRCSLFIRFQT